MMFATGVAASTAASAGAGDSPPENVRTPRDPRHAPPSALLMVVGDGWGCTQLAGYHVLGWECWNANGPSALGGRPRAWRVPRLDSVEVQVEASADRVCGFDRPEEIFRCWQRPVLGQALRESPPSPGWRNPKYAQIGDFTHDRAITAFVGGTLDCFRSPNGDLWCQGDNSFGQLGRGVGSPDAGAPPSPSFLSVRPTTSVGLGIWHGCALDAPSGVMNGGKLACWGRADYGQLGAPAKDVCVVGGKDFPCSRTPQDSVAVFGAKVAIRVGDLFTCMSDQQGIRCWGANEEAFFGEPGSCPDALRRAWPTLRGPIAAPRAACSPNPVGIYGVDFFVQDFQVGPRGLCFDRGLGNGPECIGAIETPRVDGLSAVAVSPGQSASACGLRRGAVFCWGEGYSPRDARAVPVSVDFAPLPIGPDPPPL